MSKELAVPVEAGMSRDELTSMLFRVISDVIRQATQPRPTAQEVRDFLAEHGPHSSRWREDDALSYAWDVLDALDALGKS